MGPRQDSRTSTLCGDTELSPRHSGRKQEEESICDRKKNADLFTEESRRCKKLSSCITLRFLTTCSTSYWTVSNLNKIIRKALFKLHVLGCCGFGTQHPPPSKGGSQGHWHPS